MAGARYTNNRPTISLERSKGFSLFELVVFIICVAIIYSSAANRFADFPGEAERANFLAVFSQIRSAVNLELINGMVSSSGLAISQYEKMNPMDLLLEAPSNYLGEYEGTDTSNLPSRSWYFDKTSRELVYRINDADEVFLLKDGAQIPTTELRFQVEIVYQYEDRTTGLRVNPDEAAAVARTSNNLRKRLLGMIMRPVSPYIWGTSPTFMRDYGNMDIQSD